VAVNRALVLPAGSTRRLGGPPAGLRSYLAVAGGIDVPPVLGSRSADLLSGLGPRPLRAGDRLPVGSGSAWPNVAVPAVAGAGPEAEVRLEVTAGPRADWFTPAALEMLASSVYQVTPASNRTGLRLSGPPLERSRSGELPSEGMVTGAVQVPPDGQPIVLLADHPVTGGYPVIAVVRSPGVSRAGQLRPGQRVRFDVGA
jgi:biotin-dependent carboxylase-like uncharacterized protein